MSRSNLGTPSSGKARSSKALSDRFALKKPTIKKKLSERYGNLNKIERKGLKVCVEADLNFDDARGGSVFASLNIVVEYFRWCLKLRSRRHFREREREREGRNERVGFRSLDMKWAGPWGLSSNKTTSFCLRIRLQNYSVLAPLIEPVDKFIYLLPLLFIIEFLAFDNPTSFFFW